MVDRNQNKNKTFLDEEMADSLKKEFFYLPKKKTGVQFTIKPEEMSRGGKGLYPDMK